MPASRFLVLLVVFVIVTTSSITIHTASMVKEGGIPRFLPTLHSGLDAALQWLATNESLTGSYGAFTQHWASAASYALWLNNTHSAKAQLAYSWLATQLDDSTSWFWGAYGEADVPGAVLYSLALSSNLNLINTTLVKTNLVLFQKPNGGFAGYYEVNQTVTSGIDTDMALLGLMNAQEISGQNQALAVGYLLSLQNKDGSFNLTKTTKSDRYYSLGPDTTSITAETLLALKSAGFTRANPAVDKALNYLKATVSNGFNGIGHVYAAATSALALKAYDEPDSATTAMVYILSQQNIDGGFSDTSRSSYPQSNALDSGWAAIALETKSSEEGFPGPINSPPKAAFSMNPAAPTVGVPVHFDANGSHDLDGDQLSYVWTFGDGASAVGVSPTHTYTASGNFTVTLTVTDSGGNPGPLSDTMTLNIIVQQSTIQGSSTLPFGASGLSVIVGGLGLVAIIGIAFFLGRRSASRASVRSI